MRSLTYVMLPILIFTTILGMVRYDKEKRLNERWRTIMLQDTLYLYKGDSVRTLPLKGWKLMRKE